MVENFPSRLTLSTYLNCFVFASKFLHVIYAYSDCEFMQKKKKVTNASTEIRPSLMSPLIALRFIYVQRIQTIKE